MKIYGKVEMNIKLENKTEDMLDLIGKAKLWEQMGAAGVYIKYTAQCKSENTQDIDILRELIEAVRIPVTVELGGGREYDIAGILDLGADSIVIGEEALLDEMLMERLIRNGRGKVSVFLDSCNGTISSKSWVNISEFSAYNFVGKLAEKGCKSVVFSDKSIENCLACGYDLIEKLCSIGRVKITLLNCPSSAEELLKLKDSGIDGLVMNTPEILNAYNY